jgi:hypothetical protein
MLKDVLDDSNIIKEKINSEPNAPEYEGDYKAPSKEERTKKLMQGLNKSLFDVPQKKGWKRHFFNDSGTRIQTYLDLGWRHVEIKDADEKKYYNFHVKGNRVNIRAGMKKDGTDLIAYLLEIPEQIFDENKQIKDEIRKETYKGFSERVINDSNIPENERLNIGGFKAVGKSFEHLV